MQEISEVEEPNVVPLIDVCLVILVMLLTIASHAAKTLPLLIPRTTVKTDFKPLSESALLTVTKSGAFVLKGVPDEDGNVVEGETANTAELLGMLNAQPKDTVVAIRTEPGVKYEALVKALDCIMGSEGLKVAFGESLGQPAPAPDKTREPATPSAQTPQATPSQG